MRDVEAKKCESSALTSGLYGETMTKDSVEVNHSDVSMTDLRIWGSRRLRVARWLVNLPDAFFLVGIGLPATAFC